MHANAREWWQDAEPAVASPSPPWKGGEGWGEVGGSLSSIITAATPHPGPLLGRGLPRSTWEEREKRGAHGPPVRRLTSAATDQSADSRRRLRAVNSNHK